MFFSAKAAALAVLAVVVNVHAETHTIVFTNNCGFGTPTLIQGGNVLSTGGSSRLMAPFAELLRISRLGCTLVETTLVNPSTAGSGSSTDISLIPPHAFSVTTGFGYFNGCQPAGTDCTNSGCPMAFRSPGDTFAQIACQIDNADLAITFCD
ncbi:glycopeptide [Mycena sp. CBHHK59/15]|nr:glycopeptide [Mycena sp. CBHHK59/15]